MNETDLQIILCLLDTDHMTGKAIHRETGIIEPVISKHLNALHATGIIDYKTCAPQAGKRYTGKCRYIVNAPDVFETLLNQFMDTEYLDRFIDSAYVLAVEMEHPKKRDQIITDMILSQLDGVQPLCTLFYAGSPLANTIHSLRVTINRMKNASHDT